MLFLIQAIYTADDGLIDGPHSGGTLFSVVASCMGLLLQSLLSLFSWSVKQMSMVFYFLLSEFVLSVLIYVLFVNNSSCMRKICLEFSFIFFAAYF